ncbi:membrane protein [Streptomyces caatingaensis]|uniref:Membrane protein n=1 Tax=Streptomyces caatingaensis TaxID=1678637 RepID=A0A0K9XI39_9ACTN|nr:membrane protein [Streptomyces caatingaensis]
MAEEEPGALGGLRAAFGGLTTRGRSFLAAGAAAVGCSYVLGQEDLLRVGLLLAALPLACVLVLHRTRHRVTGSRRLEPERVSAGEEARVHLAVDSASRLPTGPLLLQDRVPYELGPRPRFVLARLEPGARRAVSYRVRAELRGRYALGPLQLRVTDPFGMCRIDRDFGARQTLTVLPRCVPLPAVPLGGEAAGHGEGRHRAVALAGADDIIPRGYRHGDDLRRVHWRATARHGELMVRREEQPQRAHATVLLDTRGVAYAGAGPESAFEWAVSGAASAAVHLLGRGFAVRLVTDTGAFVPGLAGTAPADAAAPLLDALALVDHSPADDLSGAHAALRDGRTGLLVAFLGELDEHRAASTARLRARGAAALAFVLDPEVWTGAAPAPDARPLRVLREAGWAVVAVGPGDALPDAWRLAGAGGTGATEDPAAEGRT